MVCIGGYGRIGGVVIEPQPQARPLHRAAMPLHRRLQSIATWRSQVCVGVREGADADAPAPGEPARAGQQTRPPGSEGVEPAATPGLDGRQGRRLWAGRGSGRPGRDARRSGPGIGRLAAGGHRSCGPGEGGRFA